MNASTTRGPGAPSLGVPRYVAVIEATLERAAVLNASTIPAAARIVADVVSADGTVYVFGSGHSQLAALEVWRRAGSLAPLRVLFDPRYGAAEQLEGYAETLLEGVAFTARDCLFVISNSGNNAAPVEMARTARAAGTPVIAVTSTRAAAARPAQHSSGLKLDELADVVLDNAGDSCDAAVRLDGVDSPLCPTSTIAAATLLHAVLVEAIALLAGRGLDAPVYQANALPGGREHNERLRQRYRDRVGWMP